MDVLRTRRAALSASLLLPLAGCGFFRNSPFYSTVLDARRPVGPAIDQAKVESIRYASMVAFFKGTAKSLLVLGDYLPNGRLVWYSAERQSLTTWGPYIERLLGLEVSLRATRFEGFWNRDLRQMIGRRAFRVVEFQSAGKIITVAMTSTFRSGSEEVVDILGVRRKLRRITEHVVADKYHPHNNLYWIEQSTGFCWQTRQLIIPTMPTFEFRITKAPTGNG